MKGISKAARKYLVDLVVSDALEARADRRGPMFRLMQPGQYWRINGQKMQLVEKEWDRLRFEWRDGCRVNKFTISRSAFTISPDEFTLVSEA